jgi:hypothetical protein
MLSCGFDPHCDDWAQVFGFLEGVGGPELLHFLGDANRCTHVVFETRALRWTRFQGSILRISYQRK